MFLHEKWLNLDFHRQIPYQYFHIACGIFLENLVIFLIFHCKYKEWTCPVISVRAMWSRRVVI